MRGDSAGRWVPAEQPADLRLRIVDGALACVARYGMAKTTLDDVARAAGCSRATVYRTLPGGKEAVIAAMVDTEVSRLLSELAVGMGEADNLEDALTTGMAMASARLAGHEALRFLLDHEPEAVLPHLTFTHQDDLFTATAAFVSPFLGRWLAHDEALRVAEWGARIVFSYFANPAPDMDLSDTSCARRVVRTYVLPGIRVLSGASAPQAPQVASQSRTVPVPGPTADKGEAS
ncbi:MAG: TetR/AcrR family transcriptional regulator [Acidimicrobiales bacterium]